jgi:riboflavin-specific deaminase-like protein
MKPPRGSRNPVTPGVSNHESERSETAPDPLPFVFVNMAMTEDGKIAPASRVFVPLGSQRDQAHLLELRARADAVIAGARTVDSDVVTLGPGPARYRRLRLRHGLAEYNLRVIVSGSGTVNPHAAVFQHRFSPILVLTTEHAGPRRLGQLGRLADSVAVFGRRQIDFAAAFRWLRREWGVRRLLCEGGGELNGALFRAGLVNELHLTLCPRVLGGRSAPTIADGPGAVKLAEASQLTLKSMKRVGDELFLVYRVTSRCPSASAT